MATPATVDTAEDAELREKIERCFNSDQIKDLTELPPHYEPFGYLSWKYNNKCSVCVKEIKTGDEVICQAFDYAIQKCRKVLLMHSTCEMVFRKIKAADMMKPVQFAPGFNIPEDPIQQIKEITSMHYHAYLRLRNAMFETEGVKDMEVKLHLANRMQPEMFGSFELSVSGGATPPPPCRLESKDNRIDHLWWGEENKMCKQVLLGMVHQYKTTSATRITEWKEPEEKDNIRVQIYQDQEQNLYVVTTPVWRVGFQTKTVAEEMEYYKEIQTKVADDMVNDRAKVTGRTGLSSFKQQDDRYVWQYNCTRKQAGVAFTLDRSYEQELVLTHHIYLFDEPEKTLRPIIFDSRPNTNKEIRDPLTIEVLYYANSRKVKSGGAGFKIGNRMMVYSWKEQEEKKTGKNK